MYNPYDLIEVKIKDHVLYGRPVEFDSEPIDLHNLTNKDGNIIKPIKLVTVCPDCGQGIEANIQVDEPPFKVEIMCQHCNPNNINVSIGDSKTNMVEQQLSNNAEVEAQVDVDADLIKALDNVNDNDESLEEQFKNIDLGLNNIEIIDKSKDTPKKASKKVPKKASKKVPKKASKKAKKVPKKAKKPS